MFREILRFELRQQLRSPLLWLMVLGFGALTFATVASSDFRLAGAGGNVHLNAPFVVINTLGLFSMLSLFLVTVFVAGAALRDFNVGSTEILFSTPVSRRAYLGGRFAAGWLVSVLVMLAVGVGLWLGALMPWLDPTRLGPTPWSAYAFGFAVFVLPNLFFIAALVFCVASLTRSMLWSYVGVIVVFVLQQFAYTTMHAPGLEHLAAYSLLDAFGHGPFNLATRYWTAADRNTLLPSLTGVILANRVLWLAIGVALLAAAYARFKSQREGMRLFRRRRRLPDAVMANAEGVTTMTLPLVALRSGFAARCRQFFTLAWFDTRFVLRGAPFLALLFIGLGMTLLRYVRVENLPYGFWPVTHWMAEILHISYAWLLFLVVGFYAGELVWRERNGRINEVMDASPMPDWMPLLSKIAALAVVIVVFLVAGTLLAIAYQLSSGYHNLQPLLYLQYIGLDFARFLLLAMLAVVLQVLANNKFVGYGLLVVYIIGNIAMGQLHWDNHLLWYAGAPEAPYSDMNGFGSFWIGTLWFRAYWGLFAAALLVAAAMYWPRGTSAGWRARSRVAAQRFRTPARVLVALFVLGFIASGVFIFHNTHGLYRYQTYDEGKRLDAQYEKAHRKYYSLAQPRITDVKMNMAVYPRERRVELNGHYVLVNKHDQPIDELLVQLPTFTTRDYKVDLSFPAHTIEHADPAQGFTLYKLDVPLAAGASMDFGFKMHLAYHGFANEPAGKRVLHNGTFLNTHRFIPHFCYDAGRQLSDNNERRKYGLGPTQRMARREDVAAHANQLLACDSDWVHFQATLSTSPDQIALAPGYLKKSWVEDGRRYFRYVQDSPILNFFSFQSARYLVARDHWHDVALEIYYDPQDPYNIQRMFKAMKRSLDYDTRNFGPYQYRQLRILEFPTYSVDYAAQSYANTVPFAEMAGFVRRRRKTEFLDMVTMVTAHEIGHQWWGHQAIGATVQGVTMLDESLAEYSSMMVLKHLYGPTNVHRFLKQELDRYLRGRVEEKVAELPLALVENQDYIHYAKGGMVFYALQDYIGEDKLNLALRNWLAKVKFQPPPYSDTRDLIAEIRAVAGPQYQSLITDLFNKITLYDDRMVSATATKRVDGKYDVTLNVHAAKYYADGKGKETRAAMDTPVEIGVFAKSDDPAHPDAQPLYLAKRAVTDGDSTFSLVVDGEPDHVGIDPFNVLVDRVSDDNRMRVLVR